MWLVQPNVILLFTFITLAITIFLLFPAYTKWRLRRGVTQTYRDEKKRATLSKRTLRITSEGLEEISDFGEIKIKWGKMDWVTTTSTHTFFIIDQSPLIVIPKDQISSGNYDEFVKAAQDYYNETHLPAFRA